MQDSERLFTLLSATNSGIPVQTVVSILATAPRMDTGPVTLLPEPRATLPISSAVKLVFSAGLFRARKPLRIAWLGLRSLPRRPDAL